MVYLVPCFGILCFVGDFTVKKGSPRILLKYCLVPKCKKPVMCLQRKCMLDKFHSGMNFSAIGCE